MNTEITNAVIPFQGSIQPLSDVNNNLAHKNTDLSNQEKAAYSTYRSFKGANTYGRIGKPLETRSTLGENIDIFI